jgi:NAD(P)-dependent dehydrogenase (short-subunit alcohol dehydrogenase family)
VPSYLLLHGKRAVGFGAGGSIGSEVAKAFASGGAEVFLAGRSEEGLKVAGSRVAVRTERPSGHRPVRQPGGGRHEAGRMRGIAQ